MGKTLEQSVLITKPCEFSPTDLAFLVLVSRFVGTATLKWRGCRASRWLLDMTLLYSMNSTLLTLATKPYVYLIEPWAETHLEMIHHDRVEQVN